MSSACFFSNKEKIIGFFEFRILIFVWQRVLIQIFLKSVVINFHYTRNKINQEKIETFFFKTKFIFIFKSKWLLLNLLEFICSILLFLVLLLIKFLWKIIILIIFQYLKKNVFDWFNSPFFLSFIINQNFDLLLLELFFIWLLFLSFKPRTHLLYYKIWINWILQITRYSYTLLTNIKLIKSRSMIIAKVLESWGFIRFRTYWVYAWGSIFRLLIIRKLV